MDVQIATLSFAGTVTAGSELTLVSPRISSPFRTGKITASFALNTNRTTKLKFFVSSDNSAPTTGEPNGVNILDEFGQVNYVFGDAEQKIFTNEFTVKEAGAYVKIYAQNTDTFDHTVDVLVEIVLSERS